MSISTMQVILGRIKSAQPESPIAVFTCSGTKTQGLLDAYFASTVATQRLLTSPHLVGVYDCQDAPCRVRGELEAAIRSAGGGV